MENPIRPAIQHPREIVLDPNSLASEQLLGSRLTAGRGVQSIQYAEPVACASAHAVVTSAMRLPQQKASA